MKKVIMIIAVAAILVGCKGKGTRVQISDSVDKFKVEKLFVVDSITVYRFYDQGNKHFLDGIDWAEKEIFKDLIHNANEVPQIGRGRILAYSRDCGYRNLYNLYDMMYKTDCGTYQEMWELEVKAYYLDGWIYADELFDLIIKGGDSK